MVVKYTYSISGDTLNGKAFISALEDDISPFFDLAYVGTSGDDLDIFMNSTLSAGEESDLDGYVAVHPGIPIRDIEDPFTDNVIDKDLTSPPASPTIGDRYIVGASATGDWNGFDDYIAEWDGIEWNFFVPFNGTSAYVLDENEYYSYTTFWSKTVIKEHDDLSGLIENDHPQYLRTDGTNPVVANIDLDGYDIIDVDLVDGVDVSDHSSRHLPGGADAIATATAASVGAANAEGTANSFARSDHAHAVTDFTISGQEQGSLLYFDGANWVQLPPGDDGYVLTTNGILSDPTWEFNEAAGVAAQENFTKTSHGLAVGDVVRHEGPDPEDWVKAQADTADNSEALGVVSAIYGNTFTVTYSGRITGLTGLTAQCAHFLDGYTAGALITTSPAISKPILFATSTTDAIVLIERGLTGGTGTGGFGTDVDAIHDNVAGEIASITLKEDPVSDDLLIIEDSADGNNKKKILLGDLLATAGELPAVQARRTTSFSVGTSYADVPMDTTDVENNSLVVEHDDTNTDRITVKETGLYQIGWFGTFSVGTGVTTIDGRFRKNDTTELPGSYCSIAEDDEDTHLGCVGVFELTANDYVSLQVRATVGTETLDHSTFFVVRLRGPKGDAGATGATGTATAFFYADQLDNPVSSDWAVNALAPAVADTNNSGLTARRFDDTTEEGVGFMLFIPSTASNLTIRLKSRAETGAAANVVPKLYNRDIPDNGAVTSWSSGTDLTAIAMTSNEYFQYDEETIAISTLGATAGELVQFELTRNTGAGGDTLTGDWALIEIQVEFS